MRINKVTKRIHYERNIQHKLLATYGIPCRHRTRKIRKPRILCAVSKPPRALRQLRSRNAVPKVQRFPVAADTIEYSDLGISLILDEDMISYKEMQDWMQRTVDSSEDLSHDITVIILTSHNNANIKIRYEGCLPTQIGSVELNAPPLEMSPI